MNTKTKAVVESHDEDDGAYSVDQFCKQYSIGKTAFYAEVKAKRLSVKKARQPNARSAVSGARLV